MVSQHSWHLTELTRTERLRERLRLDMVTDVEMWRVSRAGRAEH